MKTTEYRWRVVYRWNPLWDWKNEVALNEYNTYPEAINDARILRQIKGIDCVKVVEIAYHMAPTVEREVGTEYITLEDGDGTTS